MSKHRKIPKIYSLSIVVLYLLIAATAIAGYLFHIPLLYGFSQNAAINPFTAICFILSGPWLALYIVESPWAKRLRVVVALCILSISILKLLELTGVSSIRFDQVLYGKKLNQAEGFKSIAPNSSLLLLLVGAIILSVYTERTWLKVTNDYFKVLGFLISYLAIMGYIYHLEIGYKVGDYVPMALNTAIGYFCFFTVVLMELPPGKFMRVVGSGFAGGRMARRAIPLILVVPIAFGYLRLLGENASLFNPSYGTALESSFMVFIVLLFVYLYARQLNEQDKKRLSFEHQVMESEQKYRTLVNSLREGVVYYNTEGEISFCNKSFLVLMGYQEGVLEGRNIYDFFLSENLNSHCIQQLKCTLQGHAGVFEEPVKTKDGSTLWLSFSSSPVYNDRGTLTAALITMVDVTERRKQMEDIEAFSASAAHDINGPLSRIEMIATLLKENVGEELDDDSLELLNAISLVTTNLRVLLKDLLHFSRLGVTEIAKKTQNTNTLVREVVETNRDVNPRAHIIIEDMPAVQADKTMLAQVFTNLVGNALKYSNKTKMPEVRIGCIEENGRKIFFVKDNGAGFDMNEAHKLFAAFKRLHTDFEGNGLGLPIVKRIVEKHGGQIWAEGRRNEGATFYFTLE
jgi:PAS domain S-box-containing protein